MQEMETRIIKINVEQIRNKLIALGCPCVKKENQENNIFDFDDKRLLNAKGYARVRIVQDMLNNKSLTYLTTKKMLSQEKYKVMEENETLVDSSESAIKILEALGLKLVQCIKKYRESYAYKNTLVEIDINDAEFCPFPYIEIESNSEEEMKEIIELLGYTLEDTTSKTIYECIASEKENALEGL